MLKRSINLTSYFILTGCLALLLTVSSSLALAQAASLNPDAPKRYEVQKGDSLWKIAGIFLQDPWMWPQLWQNNPDINNPDLIYPGDVIELLSLQQGVKLIPKAQVSKQKPEPLPYIETTLLDNYLNQSLVLDKRGLDGGLYIMEIGKEGESKRLAAKGDFITAVGEIDQEVTTYIIFRDTQTLRNPVNKRFLGKLAIALGQAELKATSGRLAELQITASSQEIKEGDTLLPFNPSLDASQLTPKLPTRAFEGQILKGVTSQSHLAYSDPVIINLGENLVEPGMLLEVLQPGRRYRNIETGEVIFANDKRKGLVMVYQTFANTSLAIIVESKQSLSVGDVLRPARPSKN